MKFNSTVALTFILLVLMLAAGAVSGLWGYAMGYEALKGVTQPDTSPSKKLTGNQQPIGDRKKLTIILREEDILKQVKEKINRGGQKVEKTKNEKESSQEEKSKEDEQKSESTTQSSEEGKELPIVARDRGITMEVVKAKEDGSSLFLEVNLQNEGSREVRFLYSFLEVRDDRGRSLSAVTDGLPGELPANGEKFSGVVKVPTALLEGVNEVSLTLTDYPDQKLQLKLSDIPVGI